MEDSGQRHTPAAIPPEKRTSVHFTGGGLGPTADLDGCGASLEYFLLNSNLVRGGERSGERNREFKENNSEVSRHKIFEFTSEKFSFQK
jgi:hypothetical protein